MSDTGDIRAKVDSDRAQQLSMGTNPLKPAVGCVSQVVVAMPQMVGVTLVRSKVRYA